MLKVKKLIEILSAVDPESNLIFKLDDDAYSAKSLEIFDVMKSCLRESDGFDVSGDIHIIFKV